jgi:hypothetical protein
MSLDRSYGAHNASRVQELAVEREMFERRNHELQKTNGALQEEVRGSRLCVRACVCVCRQVENRALLRLYIVTALHCTHHLHALTLTRHTMAAREPGQTTINQEQSHN